MLTCLLAQARFVVGAKGIAQRIDLRRLAGRHRADRVAADLDGGNIGGSCRQGMGLSVEN